MRFGDDLGLRKHRLVGTHGPQFSLVLVVIVADPPESRGSYSASNFGACSTHGHVGNLSLRKAEPLADQVLVAAEGNEQPNVLDGGVW